MGLRIVAIDRNPEAPGMKLADVAVPIDTRDEVGAVAVARRERVEGVLTLCTDFPVRTVAAIAYALGLPGPDPEVAMRATHKGLMRDAFLKSGAPSPEHRRVRTAAEAHSAAAELGYPVVLKPTSASGSRGVAKVMSPGQIPTAWAHTSAVAGAGAEVVVEEFVNGPEVSVEVVSWHGEHRIVAITDKLTTGDPFWVEMGHSQPSALGVTTHEAIKEATRAGLDALGAVDATAHVEIKVSARGPRLIEVGLRLGGDFIATELTSRATGVNMTKAAIDIALGREPNTQPRWSRGAAIRYMAPAAGTVTAISGEDAARKVPGVKIVEVYVRSGDRVGRVMSSLDRSGHVLAACETAEHAVAAAEAGAKLVSILTAPETVLT